MLLSFPREEKEWTRLFNGQNLEGWVPKIHRHDVGENYANTFRVENGQILVSYADYADFGERYGHLFYEKPFSSFHLKWEYRFTEEWLTDAPIYTYRNSGVMFHSQSPESILKVQDWPISVEYQMLAEEKEGVSRPTGNMCSPGTDVFFEGEKDPRHCINSTSPTFRWDEWVKAELIVYRDSIIHHLVNGDTVLTYTQPQIGGGVANRFDPEIKIDGAPLSSGYIGLQSEGQGVLFREILIREL
ncbi:3-keto-disaccharide hydrolase [Algoriphagus namhaensis]